MPQMGESIAEGTIIKWLKKEGDVVDCDEPLFEITTDKVDTEVPAPAAGTLTEILVKEGETVDIGTLVAVITESGGDVKTVSPGEGIPSKVDTGLPVGKKGDEPGSHFRAAQSSQVISLRREPEKSDDPSALPTPSRSFSPAVLKTAERGGISFETLATLQGSGHGGRVTKRDVEQYILQQATTPLKSDSSAGPPQEYLYQPKDGDERIQMSAVRKKIAHHMSWSTRISPHATAIVECDMSRAAELMETAGQRFEASVDAPLTYTVLVAQATVKALGEFRTLNASVVGDEIVLKPSVNLGIAVALPESGELIVPVIRKAEERSLAGFAQSIKELAMRARSHRLTPKDVQGGTFTLTNPGIFGGLTGTPILNQPEVAILGLGAVIKRPVVVDDAIIIRPVMMMSLTFDHRASDGMAAFQFLARVREHLEALPTDFAEITDA